MSNDLDVRLRLGLDAEAQGAPPEPPLGDVIDQCGRDLARHNRRLTIVGAGVAVVAVVAAITLPFLLGGASDEARVADDGRPLSDAVLIETCREGSQPAYWTDLVFGSGTPRVAARSDAGAKYSSTILVSADGTYWADCFNAENAYANTPGALSDEPGRSSMTVFENVPADYRPSYSAGGTCPQAQFEGCDGFRVDYADRLPDAVAAVDFTTADGRTTRVSTNADGFVVFDYEGLIPAEAKTRLRRVVWIAKMVYVDANGTPLAANLLDARHLGDTVDGLPPLTDYPSLARTVMEASPEQ